MIGLLEGEVRGTCVVCGGVGYQVATPRALDEGAAVTLHVTTVVSEGAISLYGFESLDEQTVFAVLRRVQGVGPQVALALLRDVGVAGIAQALKTRDASALVAGRGVGRKLAERIVVGATLDDEVVERLSSVAAPVTGLSAEVVSTLSELGFDGSAAAQAVRDVTCEHPDADEQTLLSGALDRLRSNR